MLNFYFHQKAPIRCIILFMNNELRTYRLRNGYTQKEMASLLEMPYRTYQNYESETTTMPKWLLKLILFKLNTINNYSLTEGIYSVKQIKFISIPIFMKFNIKFAYLIGDYERTKSEEKNLEFLIDGNITLAYQFKLKESLENEFKKRVLLYCIDDFDVKGEFVKNSIRKGEKIINLYDD